MNETLDMVCTPQAMKMKQISLTYSYCETDVIVSVGQGLYLGCRPTSRGRDLNYKSISKSKK